MGKDTAKDLETNFVWKARKHVGSKELEFRIEDGSMSRKHRCRLKEVVLKDL